MIRVGSILAFLLLCGAASAAAQTSPAGTCPGLDDSGQRLPLSPAEVSNEAIGLPALIAVPSDLAQSARAIIARLEAGGGDAYLNVGGIDGISLGYLQWNHGTGSLYDTFLRDLDPVAVQAAPISIRRDLQLLKERAVGAATAADANRVIADWTTARPGDPLASRVRRSVRRDLSIWLGSPLVRLHQDSLVNRRMQSSYRLARAWVAATDPSGARPVDSRLLAYFFDLEVFNGDRAGLWVGHVRPLRAQYDTPAKVMAFVSEWVEKCRGHINPSATDSRLYNVATASKNARYWSALVRTEPARFDPMALDLIVFGYLRAIRSVGKNGDRGFPGIFQADVFNRRALIAIGKGHHNGATAPSLIFAVR